jgi:hypothetical protein
VAPRAKPRYFESVMATLERAIEIAVQAHKGVKDRAGRAYILHPIGVMGRVKSEKEKIVAILHDVVEDSKPPNRWDFDDLRAEGFDEDIVAAIDCVTKHPGENYEAFILRAVPNPLDPGGENRRPGGQYGPAPAGVGHREGPGAFQQIFARLDPADLGK